MYRNQQSPTHILAEQKVHLLILFIVYAAFSFFTHAQYGIKVVNDSARYLEYASNLESGFYFDPHNFWYIGYPLYILMINQIGGELSMIIAGQYLLGLAAVGALYLASLKLWNRSASAFFSAIMFVAFIDIVQWNAYILTESVYTSFICFSLLLLLHLLKEKRAPALYLACLAIVMFTSLVKPTGFALMAAPVIVFLFEVTAQLKSRLWKVVFRTCIVLLLLILVNRMLETFRIIENYQKGEIVYAITTLPPSSEYQMLTVAPPDPLYTPETTLPPLVQIFLFIVNHPLYWAKLFCAKVFLLFSHVRPYWSFTHNVFSIGFLLPAYVLFVRAVRSVKKNPVARFAWVYLALHALSVGITSVDWDARFLIPMLPVIFLFAGQGLWLYITDFASEKRRLL